MKAHLNTNLFPIISVGMYCSPLAPESIFDDYQINQDKQDGYIYFDAEYFNDNFQNDLYEEAVQERANYFLSGSHEANGIEIEIKTGQIYSPSYYNFATDQIDLEVKFNKTKVLKYAKDHQGELDYFLRKHFTSYDGFYSHTANNYQDWLQDFKDNNVQSIGAVLTFIFVDELDDFRQGFYELCNSELYYNEFVDTTSIDAEQKLVENYVCQNYQTFNLEDIEELDLEFLGLDAIYKIASLKLAEIESNTFELELI